MTNGLLSSCVPMNDFFDKTVCITLIFILKKNWIPFIGTQLLL
jgi:hypothetical protein